MDQNIPRTNIPQSNGIYKPLLVSVIFIATCCIALFAYHFFLVKYMRWRLRNNVSPPRTMESTNVGGVEQKLLESIPIIIYSDKNQRALCLDQTECAVCLGELEEVDMVRVFPGCKHPFHVPCIDQWLGGHVSCPLCRNPVSVAASDTVLELPIELGRGNDVADEDTLHHLKR